mgnify:CR=1
GQQEGLNQDNLTNALPPPPPFNGVNGSGQQEGLNQDNLTNALPP